MDQFIQRLEALLDRMADPEKLSAEELATLPGEWERAVQRLSLAAEAFAGEDVHKKRPFRERLEALMARLPAIQEGLTRYQDEVARQLYAENRRVQAMRQYQSGQSRDRLLRTRV
ncbi:MAG: hypothetical protein HQL82_05575 [Magnetococcales bacterium]|nr:hypothetical protein [Magnetococcales bacterium]